MHVEFTIPVWVFWALLAYYVAGFPLSVYLAVFQRHYISPRYTALATLRKLRWRFVPITAAIWPAGAYLCARDAVRYGWKGF